MFHHPVLVTPPADTPISLAEAKAHLIVEHVGDDALIAGLIAAAVEHFDGWAGTLGRCLESQVWRQDFDEFARSMALPLGPVTSIESVKWRARDGQLSTVVDANYALATDAAGQSLVRFVDAYSLPSDLYQSGAVSIEYTAGYARTEGGTSAVPAPIRAAMLLLIGHWWTNREAVNVGNIINVFPMSVDALVAPYKVQRV